MHPLLHEYVGNAAVRAFVNIIRLKLLILGSFLGHLVLQLLSKILEGHLVAKSNGVHHKLLFS